MKQFWEGLAAAVFFVLVGYVICLLANYDELIHPCPPCPEAVTMEKRTLILAGVAVLWCRFRTGF